MSQFDLTGRPAGHNHTVRNRSGKVNYQYITYLPHAGVRPISQGTSVIFHLRATCTYMRRWHKGDSNSRGGWHRHGRKVIRRAVSSVGSLIGFDLWD